MITIDDFQTIETLNANNSDQREFARRAAKSELSDLENLFEEARTSEDNERIAELRAFLTTA